MIATNEFRANGAPERTEYHNLVAWDRLAEICGQFLSKGHSSTSNGRLRWQALVCHCSRGAALLGYVLAWHRRRISSTTCSIGAVASMTTPFSGTSSFV